MPLTCALLVTLRVSEVAPGMAVAAGASSPPDWPAGMTYHCYTSGATPPEVTTVNTASSPSGKVWLAGEETSLSRS